MSSSQSQFTSLSTTIDRKPLFLYHACVALTGHTVRMPQVRKTLDAYALERLKKDVATKDIIKEINNVFDKLVDVETYKKMVRFVDGYDAVGAVECLQRCYLFTVDESRLALCVLQLTTNRILIAEAQTVEVTVLGDTPVEEAA